MADGPCCDYRDHSGRFCTCPDHKRSKLHPFGSEDDEATARSLVALGVCRACNLNWDEHEISFGPQPPDRQEGLFDPCVIDLGDDRVHVRAWEGLLCPTSP